MSKSNCDICGAEIEVQMCCSGWDCGCMGQPTEPPVCSSKCYDEFKKRIKILTDKRQKLKDEN